MSPYTIEWLNLIVRWIHLITGIAWIGASFYFNWLEGNLNRSGTLAKGVAGDLWAVHGGGFYHVQKYDVAPDKLPETLHWFKWEAYLTWVSGMALLCIVYYLSPGVYLIDKSVADIPPFLGIILGLATIALAWHGYDRLCQSSLIEKPTQLFALIFFVLTIIAFFLTHIFNARAAYIHVGAVIGTIMAANVFFVIIPSQQNMVDALQNGQTPDGKIGKQGFTRSLHNNYFTLPILFIMISNHFPATFSHALNWLILAALSAIGIAVRHYFNLRNRGYQAHWILPAAALAILGLAILSAPKQLEIPAGSVGVSDQQAFSIIQERCSTCHASRPVDANFKTAPNGLVFDTIDDMKKNATGIYARSVATDSMPLANMTRMTAEERALLGRWYQAIQSGE